MAEISSERAERRIWTPEVVDEQRATLRSRGPGQDAAATALAAALVDLADEALRDRPAAEAIVGDIMQREDDLVAAATRAVSPTQRQAAEAALARMVRRAMLDALPPVVPIAKLGTSDSQSGVTAPSSRKLRPVKSKPATGEATPRGSRWRRRLAALAALLVVVLGGIAAWQLLPDGGVEPAAPTAEPVTGAGEQAAMSSPDALQLEAAEPSGGPLRQMAPRPDAAPALAGASDLMSADGPAAQTEAAAQPEPAEDTAAPPAGVLPIRGGGLRVFILYPEGEPAVAEAEALYGALSRTGQLPTVVLRDVSFAVGAPRIRYYHADDAAAAAALADFLDPPNGRWVVQDFGHIRPLPLPGTVEIYVPSEL